MVLLLRAMGVAPIMKAPSRCDPRDIPWYFDSHPASGRRSDSTLTSDSPWGQHYPPAGYSSAIDFSSRSTILMSIDTGELDAGREACPVLPCVQYTAINADRIGQEEPAAPSVPEVGQSRQLTAALVLISTAQLMVVLDATIVAVALPSIQRALHFSTANLQWIVTAYTLTFGGLLLLGGRLGDVFGRRRMFVFGLALFSVASLVGGLATTGAWLIAARAVQGIGGAIAAPTALALIGDTFPEGPARTRATGIYAAMSGAGGAVGLLLGGILTDYASWRWVLFVNAPIGALVVVAAPRVLERTAPRGGKIDVPGALLATAGMTALVYGLVRAPAQGWANAITVTALAGGLALL